MMELYEYEYGDHIKREYLEGVQQRIVKIKKIEKVLGVDEGWEKISAIEEKEKEEWENW